MSRKVEGLHPLSHHASHLMFYAARWLLYFLLAATCCLLLVACYLPGTVRPTVKIGLVAPFEGRYRYVGYDLFPAVRLALREANEAGGVGGYNVELAAYDDGGDPAMAVQQVEKLAMDPEVMAVLGHFRAETTAAAAFACAEAGLPLAATGGLEPMEPPGGEGVFFLGPAADEVAQAMLEGVDAAALITQGGPLGQALGAAAEKAGVWLIPRVSPQDPDWLESIVEAHPAVILCDADPVTAGEVVAALRAAGWMGEFRGGPVLAAADFAAVAGEAAEEVWFPSPWAVSGGAEADREFAAAYEEISGGMSPGPLALPAYQATKWLLEALEADISAHRTPSREGVAAALEALH